ncbi:MAG: RNase adapter RapZ [Alphaproteobacteria bacterium]|nr:RNase adapter RapZ [Alphaproteobacteria bacterium]
MTASDGSKAQDAPIPDPTTLVLVTGLSGAGRSSALAILEDEGFEAVDNLPLSLLPALMALDPAERPDRIAVGVDLRTRDFDSTYFFTQLDQLSRDPDLTLRVVFLDCDTDVLIRRFTETRRRHPLATDRPVADGIRLERDYMSPIRARADVVIDTSELTLGSFRQILLDELAFDQRNRMTVTVVSFGFRKGLPREADLVFDVRFLKNPHYVAELRPKTGLDPEVAAYVSSDPEFPGFVARLTALIAPLLPRYEAEGKSYLTIAIGCTGGKHRSVHTAELFATWLKSQGTPVTLRHRDIPAPAGGAG